MSKNKKENSRPNTRQSQNNADKVGDETTSQAQSLTQQLNPNATFDSNRERDQVDEVVINERSPDNTRMSNKSRVSSENTSRTSKAKKQRDLEMKDHIVELTDKVRKLQKSLKKYEGNKQRQRQSIGDPQTAEAERKCAESERKLMNKLFEIKIGDPMHLILKCNNLLHNGVTYAKEDSVPTTVAAEYVRHRVSSGKAKKGSSNEEVDEIDKTPRRTIVNGVLANKNGENNKDEDNHTSDRSSRSDITTGSSESGSREPGRYGDDIDADQRESPTVKYGVWWILRVAHIQTIERARGKGVTDLTDQRLDVVLLSKERLSNEETLWQRQKTKFNADLKGHDSLSYASFRHMLTEYMKHINKGKQQVEIDVYMWGSLSDKFKTDFKNKYRQQWIWKLV